MLIRIRIARPGKEKNGGTEVRRDACPNPTKEGAKCLRRREKQFGDGLAVRSRLSVIASKT